MEIPEFDIRNCVLLNSPTFLANPIISPIKKIRHLNTEEAYGMKGYQLFRKDGLGRPKEEELPFI